MNKLDKTYTDLLQDILDNGVTKQDRTGTGTISVFGRQIRHDMKDGFPLLTTKKMPWKSIVTELLWFLRGDTNIKYLVDNGCNIWNGDAYKNYLSKYRKDLTNGEFESKGGDSVYIPDPNTKYGKLRPYTQEEFINKIKTDDEFANKWGELGPIYGKQWRKWETYDNEQPPYLDVDQISNLINDLKTNPDSRRLMVNAWNVGELDQMVLPPCHYGFQVYTRELSFDEFWDRLTPKQRGNMEKPYEGETYNSVDSRVEAKNIIAEVHNLPTRAISLMWNQRSVDTFLGLPFNIASYGLLLEIIAKEVNMVPEEVIGNLGDVHLYSNHIDAAKEQIGRELTDEERIKIYRDRVSNWKGTNPGISENWDKMDDKEVIAFLNAEKIVTNPKRTREPFPLPTLRFSPCPITGIDMEYQSISQFQIENYQSHPTIKAPLSN